MPDWRLDIEQFGRIERASIRMAPLVLLVGRNNSGKSYVASLLWSLLNFENTIFGRRGRAAVPAWFTAFLERDDRDEAVDKTRLQGWLNAHLLERKDELAKTLLSYESARIGRLNVSFGDAVNCYLSNESWHFADDDQDFTISHGIEPRGEHDVQIEYALGDDSDGVPELAARTLLIEAVEAVMSGRQHLTFGATPLYIPAARTGLMLALPLIFTELLGQLGLSGDGGAARFSLPTINFLQRIVGAKSAGGGVHQTSIADMLEASLLHGSIRRDDATGPNFSYAPAEGDALPLHTASSMVSELAPFLVMLRSANMEVGLVFEEPESHLHLSAQREVARAIARLVNNGVPVVLTTHSDTFVQQLNILIALHDHPDRAALMERFGYEDDDLIDRQDARGYEFLESSPGRTMVRDVKVIDAGFVVPSLNDVLLDLSEQAISSQGR